MIANKYLKRIRAAPGKKIRLGDFSTDWAQERDLKDAEKEAFKEKALKMSFLFRAFL